MRKETKNAFILHVFYEMKCRVFQQSDSIVLCLEDQDDLEVLLPSLKFPNKITRGSVSSFPYEIIHKLGISVAEANKYLSNMMTSKCFSWGLIFKFHFYNSHVKLVGFWLDGWVLSR